MKKIIIVGASGHGKVCADIARVNGYDRIEFLDDDKSIYNCAEYKVIGVINDFKKYVEDAVFFIAIGNAKIRKMITRQIRSLNGDIVTLRHPNSVIAKGVKVGMGSVIMAGVVINSGTIIGKGCIINTSSSVDHDCEIGDFVHVSVGAHIAGTVKIGNETWIGAGAIISNNLAICAKCMIGAGAVVIRDIRCLGTYVGCPARIKG